MNSIYITDLDHTFLRTDLSVSDYTKDIWNAKSKKTILTIATARSFQKSNIFLKGLNLTAPLILLDGSMVVTPQKKLIEIHSLDRDITDAIIDEGIKFNIYPFIIAIKDIDSLDEAFIVPSQLNAHQIDVLKNYQDDPRVVHEKNIRAKDINLKVVYFGDYETLRLLNDKLQDIFGGDIEYKLSPEKYSDGYFLTLLHPKSDKGNAMQKVFEYLEKKELHSTVFGDSINDIGMFKKADTSVAVQNALNEVKDVATIVLKETNDEDGVAKYLDR